MFWGRRKKNISGPDHQKKALSRKKKTNYQQRRHNDHHQRISEFPAKGWKRQTNIEFSFSSSSSTGASAEAPVPLLNWEIVHEKMPWNILLLLGGGFALAHGSEVTPLPFPDPWAPSETFCQCWDTNSAGSFTEIWSFHVAGTEFGAAAEHPSGCHLHPPVPAGGHVHRVLQQHGYHHALPAHTGLHGELEPRKFPQ